MVKKKIFSAIAVVLLAAAGYFGWAWFHRNTPENLILRQLNELAECASKPAGEGTSGGLLKIHALPSLFMPECELEFRVEMFRGRYTTGELEANLARYRVIFEQVKVGVKDPVVHLESPDTAVAEFTGTLNGRTKTGSRLDEIRELKCRFRLTDGKWLIESMTVRDILQK